MERRDIWPLNVNPDVVKIGERMDPAPSEDMGERGIG